MSLLELLQSRPEDVLLPSEAVRSEALENLKAALDSVAPNYSPLDAVHVDGLKADQVWVQAQMVLDGVAEKLSAAIAEFAPKSEPNDPASNDDSEDLSDSQDDRSDASADESPDEFGGNESAELEQDSEEEVDAVDMDDFKDDYVDEDNEDEASDGDEESDMNIEDNQRETESKRAEMEGSDREEQFDLAEFQQHVLRLEQDGSEDDGPEIDFNAEVGGSSEDESDMHYSDFFGSAPRKAERPPAKKKVQFKDGDDDELWSDQEQANADEAGGDDEEDMLSLTRKDLFDDDEDVDSAEPEALSKFEKQQMELSRQIEELEAENMGQKEWGMRGEAKAKDRPEDSLFSIQFDRSSKPAPIITEESTASLEDLIKARIKKQQFDDIPRRSELVTQAAAQRELPELSERRSDKSLAELYEDDRMRAENPEYFSKQNSAAMDAAHQEIVALYTSVARRLDALCSWAYTPKPAAPGLQVVTQGPSIAMEEAQPGTLAPEEQLAPQEVYKSESATPMDNSEMTTSMKRKRRRDKSLQKGGKSQPAPGGKRTKRDTKESIYSTLKQGNVTMVDRRGDKRDMHGNKVKDNGTQTAAHMKL